MKTLKDRTAPAAAPGRPDSVVETHGNRTRSCAEISGKSGAHAHDVQCDFCKEALDTCECDPVEYMDGGSWLFDQPEEVPSRWGIGKEVLWAEGQALILAGPQGTGKTTISGQLVRALVGLQDSVLGFPVKPATRVLYLAMDRPRQISMAIARSFDPEDRPTASERLTVRPGPPWKDLAENQNLLRNMALKRGCDVIIVDSLKDAAIGLTDDEVGAGWNRARQTAIAAGIDVLELHHLVKNRAASGHVRTIDEVYGSTWITSGSGSVLLLVGEPGDSLVELHNLKTIADCVGPLKVEHDHDAGTSRVIDGASPLALLAASDEGMTAPELAKQLFSTDHPTDRLIEKARRLLNNLVKDELALLASEEPGGQGGRPLKRYMATTSRTTVQSSAKRCAELDRNHISDGLAVQTTTGATMPTTPPPTSPPHSPARGGGRRATAVRDRKQPSSSGTLPKAESGAASSRAPRSGPRRATETRTTRSRRS